MADARKAKLGSGGVSKAKRLFGGRAAQLRAIEEAAVNGSNKPKKRKKVAKRDRKLGS